MRNSKSESESEENFEDIFSSDLSSVNLGEVTPLSPYRIQTPSTKHQRFLIEELGGGRTARGWKAILETCGEVTGRVVKDTGELTLDEADRVIRKIKGRR